jgi:hypothetical protein
MLYFLIAVLLAASSAQAQFSSMLFNLSGVQGAQNYYLLRLGDQNDDGFDDIGVVQIGSPDVQAGVRIYFGGAPMDTNPDVQIPAPPDTILRIEYGETIGDLNGDGYMDWVVAYTPNPSTSEFLYVMYPGGPFLNHEPIFSLRDNYYTDLLSVGDFNADGYDDLALYYSPHLNNIDHALIYFGGASIDTIPDWQFTSPQEISYQARPLARGDINGDGIPDFMSDSYSVMFTTFFWGGAQPDTIPDIEWINFEAQTSNIVSDITGDGLNDLVVDYAGTLDVHPGGPGLSRIAQYHLISPYSGSSSIHIESGGDLNADGVGDLLVYRYGDSEFEVFLGNRWLRTTHVQVIRTYSGSLLFGRVLCAGDVNGDGADDILTRIGDSMTRIYSGNPSFILPTDEPPIQIVQSLDLYAYPNPFNPLTNINISLPRLSPVTLELFDVLGRKVETLHSGPLERGTYSFQINGSNLASGSYLVVAQTDQSQISKRITLVR